MIESATSLRPVSITQFKTGEQYLEFIGYRIFHPPTRDERPHMPKGGGSTRVTWLESFMVTNNPSQKDGDWVIEETHPWPCDRTQQENGVRKFRDLSGRIYSRGRHVMHYFFEDTPENRKVLQEISRADDMVKLRKLLQ